MKKYSREHSNSEVAEQLYINFKIKTTAGRVATIINKYNIKRTHKFRSKNKIKTDYTKLKDLSKEEKEVLEEKRHLKEKGIIPDDDVPEGWEGDEIE